MNIIFPAIIITVAIVEIVFAKRIQAYRDRKRIANGKEAETTVSVRRYFGILGIIYGVLIVCYVYL